MELRKDQLHYLQYMYKMGYRYIASDSEEFDSQPFLYKKKPRKFEKRGIWGYAKDHPEYIIGTPEAFNTQWTDEEPLPIQTLIAKKKD